ncbi:hypothetical protein C8F01DRAFT_1086736 [Mycena amicta]|nr:hypothetical protein C8F01DRAFT_1086736 [Mycena amicta]
MSVPKLLCIFAATGGLHVASTSPNPPLRTEERVIAPTTLESILGSYYLRSTQTVLFWIMAIAETFVTLLQVGGPVKLRQHMLTLLALGGDAANIRPSGALNMAVGATLIAFGAMLRVLCYRELGSHFTFELGLLKDHRLITTGPYRVVRHPSYAGALLAYSGLLVYYASPGSWVMECLIRGSVAGGLFGALYGAFVLFVVTGLVLRIPKEDQGLREKFGEEWEKWAGETYALVPGFY